MSPFPTRALFPPLLLAVATAVAAEPLYDQDNGPISGIYNFVDSTEGATLLPKGRFSWSLSSITSSHAATDRKGDELIVLDGETTRAEFRLRYAPSARLELGLELPYIWHSEGHLDSLIDGWHDVFGLPGGSREIRATDILEFRYEDLTGERLNFTESTSGIGDLRLSAGWRLDDEAIGIPFIDKARELDVKIVCAHKGLSQFGLDPSVSSADDIGVVAPMFPDVSFLVYHSGFEVNVPEGPYDPTSRQGVDTLVRAVLDNGIGKQGNVYAELGSTWRFLMTNPDAAGHVLGKLLLHLGEDRILWGTDSIWYGAPQDQISAFRAFEIGESMQEIYGYPALTERAKEKILGLNAAALYGVDVEETRCAIREDDFASAKLAMEADPALRRPSYRQPGPQSRREFLRYLKIHEDLPG